MRKTKIVHVLKDKYDVYIGRANQYYDLPQSPFANPFVIGKDGNRTEVIDKYRIYIRKRTDLLKKLKKLKGKRLACWCRTEGKKSPACHGDVIVELLKEINHD